MATILAVFAHPDDEAFPTGGTLAHYAQQGHQVYLACATKGEAGQVKDPTLGPVGDLGALRAAELEASCAALGIHPPLFLGFHDSGRKERVRQEDPLALQNADWLQVEASIRQLIAQLQPSVLITFDPHGGYGHIDHLVVHRAATAAFFSSGHLPNPPQRLFYVVSSIERIRAMQQERNIFQGLEPEVYGVSPQTLAFVLDASTYIPHKTAAIAAHRSQFVEYTQAMNQDPARRAMMEKLMASESFALGGSRGPLPHWPMHDLLEGL